MKRSMCGIVLLAAATALWSCNGDPTGSIRDEGQRVIADPTSLFLEQGATKFVTVQLVDGQGNQLETAFTPQNVGAAVTVVEDTTFLQTSTGHIRTSQRFIVTGVGPGASSFDMVSGGTSLTIPVRVIPASFAATFSNAAPAANEPVTITLPAGYKFVADAGATTDLGAAIVQSYSVDSTALVVLLPPGSSGPVTLNNVEAAFLPGLTLTGLPTDATVTVGAVTPQAGTGATGTAPTLTLPPADDGPLGFFDGGTYDYAAADGPARLYKFVVADSVDLTTSVDWPSAEDLGLYFYASDGATAAGDPADSGGGGEHPESVTNTFAPGTYFMAVVNFSATNPPFYGITVTATTPVAAAP